MNMDQLISELIKDHAECVWKAGRHGQHAVTWMRNAYFLWDAKKAVSHARLAASHARRALGLEGRLNAVLFFNHSPLYAQRGEWYFLDEAWTTSYGPYPSYEEARVQFGNYCRVNLGERTAA